jgi:hypothetical protein
MKERERERERVTKQRHSTESITVLKQVDEKSNIFSMKQK